MTDTSPEHVTTEHPAHSEQRTPTLLEQLGGIGGLVASAVPVVVFVAMNPLAGLVPAIWTSLGALSAAASVFDAALLHTVLTARGAQLQPHLSGAAQAALASLTAVDGSLLPALPRMLWAVWHDDQHRAATMHVAFAVLRHGPVDVTVTAGNASERAE